MSLQRGLQLAVESLHHAIGLGVVGSRTGSLNSQQLCKCLPQVGFKPTAAIHDDRGGDAEAGDPAADEGLSDGLSGDGGDGKGFRPLSEMVYTYQDVGEALRGWKWTYQVNMNGGESRIGGREGREGGNSVAMNLGTLTWDAGTGPPTYIRINTRAGSDKPLGCSDTWVGEAVQ